MSRSRRKVVREKDGQQSANRPVLIAVGAIAALWIVACLCLMFGFSRLGSDDPSTLVTDPPLDETTAILTLAHSPDKTELVRDLAIRFNEKQLRTGDREVMQVRLTEMAPDAMVEEALEPVPPFQALTPDSSLWLDQIDRRWAEQQQVGEDAIAPTLLGESVRFAVSPIVIATWLDVARSLGWPDQPVGWETIQQRAASDPDFRWSHPSTSQASGLLATLAEFYAGAGKTRGLTEADATAQETIDYVAAIEKTVKFYGEGESAILQRILAEGKDFLDAFVVQEQLVINYNQNTRAGRPPGLVAIYPAEGTLWADHPLALLETDQLTGNQRQTFRAFRDYVLSPEAQNLVLAAGFRPADLSLSLEGSPVSAAYGVDPSQPQTTLQMPGPAVVDVVQNVWQFTKRKTNVYLVVDTSGSMEGAKLEAAQVALQEFLDQVQGDQERVGLVEFSTYVNNIDPLDELGNNRAELERSVATLQASGDTALLDAIWVAYARLQEQADPERINAIVAMTDGRENASGVTPDQLRRVIEEGNRSGVPVVIFAIAFGDDADYDVLQGIAQSSGGQVRQGDLETIRQLYRILSSYF